MAYTFFTSFKKTLNKSSSRCMYRQMNSAKYVEKRCFRTPNLGRFDFACLQCPSIFIGMINVFVHEFYSGSLFGVHRHAPRVLEYAFQQFDTIIVPGSIQSWIMGNSMSSSHFSTATRKHFLLSSSIPPNTHCPSTWCPLWYFLLPNLLSSIWTTFPFPPSFSLFSRSVISHTSQQKLSQSTPMLSPSFILFFFSFLKKSPTQHVTKPSNNPLLKWSVTTF